MRDIGETNFHKGSHGMKIFKLLVLLSVIFGASVLHGAGMPADSAIRSEPKPASKIFDFILGKKNEEAKKLIMADPTVLTLKDLYGDSPLMLAISYTYGGLSNRELVDFMLKQPNVKDFINTKNCGQITALCFIGNQLAFVAKKEGLYHFVYRAHLRQLAKLLLDAGADATICAGGRATEIINEIKGARETSVQKKETLQVDDALEKIVSTAEQMVENEQGYRLFNTMSVEVEENAPVVYSEIYKLMETLPQLFDSATQILVEALKKQSTKASFAKQKKDLLDGFDAVLELIQKHCGMPGYSKLLQLKQNLTRALHLIAEEEKKAAGEEEEKKRGGALAAIQADLEKERALQKEAIKQFDKNAIEFFSKKSFADLLATNNGTLSVTLVIEKNQNGQDAFYFFGLDNLIKQMMRSPQGVLVNPITNTPIEKVYGVLITKNPDNDALVFKSFGAHSPSQWPDLKEEIAFWSLYAGQINQIAQQFKSSEKDVSTMDTFASLINDAVVEKKPYYLAVLPAEKDQFIFHDARSLATAWYGKSYAGRGFQDPTTGLLPSTVYVFEYLQSSPDNFPFKLIDVVALSVPAQAKAFYKEYGQPAEQGSQIRRSFPVFRPQQNNEGGYLGWFVPAEFIPAEFIPAE
jgi:hypothetical protein